MQKQEQKFQKALEVNASLAKYIYVNYAIFYSLQGLTDKAFESLEKAFQEGYDNKNDAKYITYGK